MTTQALERVKLWRGQQRLRDRIEDAWRRGQPAVFYTGRRGGATTVALDIAREYGDGVLVAQTQRGAEVETEGRSDLLPCSALQLRRWLEGRERPPRYPLFPNGGLVVFNHPFWTSGSESLARMAHALGHRVLALGSPGAEPWQRSGYIPSIPTWELSDEFSAKDFDDLYAMDAIAADRDFGCHRPRDGSPWCTRMDLAPLDGTPFLAKNAEDKVAIICWQYPGHWSLRDTAVGFEPVAHAELPR